MKILYYTLLISLALFFGNAQSLATEPIAIQEEQCGCEVDPITNETKHTCKLNTEEKQRLLIDTATSDMIKNDGERDYVDTNFDGWGSITASIVSIITIFASLVTILGFVELLRNIYKGRVSRECQKMIIVDLIRHFIINLAILEGIRIKMRENKRPEEGTFARFAILDSDLELGRFTISADNYDTIHEVSLYMRNFNIMSELADRHFSEASVIYGNEILDNDIRDLHTRMHNCIKKLWIMQIRMGYGTMEERVGNYYVDSYTNYQSIDLNKYPELQNVKIPMEWSEKDIASFIEFHKPHRFFSRNPLRVIKNTISLFIRSVILILELLYHLFDGRKTLRIIWYKFCSHHRKPTGWRTSEGLNKMADTFRNSIAARLEDIKYFAPKQQ